MNWLTCLQHFMNWLTCLQRFMNWLQHVFRAAGHDIGTPKMADVRFPRISLKRQRKNYNKVQIMAEYSSGTVPLRASRHTVIISSVCSAFLKSVSSQASFPSRYRASTHYLFSSVTLSFSFTPYLSFPYK